MASIEEFVAGYTDAGRSEEARERAASSEERVAGPTVYICDECVDI